jgi:hypothetical protein
MFDRNLLPELVLREFLCGSCSSDEEPFEAEAVRVEF